MTYPRTVTAQLLDNTETLMGAVDMSYALGIQFYDEENGVGRGQLTMPLSQAAAVELIPGRFIDCLVEGTSRFTFKIEGNPEYGQIEIDEEFAQVVTVQGRGHGINFDEAIIYPEVALNLRLDTPWRLFSFASPSFPNESVGPWAAAVELYEYLDGVTEGLRKQMAPDGNLYPSPIGFPWPLSVNNYGLGPIVDPGYSPTYWIWSEEGNPSEEYEIGWCFFRNEFTLASDTTVTFAITGDNYFTLFLEGVPILGENADHWIWQGWKEISVALPAGTYTVAAVVENVGFPGQTGPISTNPGGFIMTVHQVDGNQEPIFVHLVTDDSWTCEFVSNMDKWPGWTPGQILIQLITEATARGALATLDSYTFTATDDTDSDDWRPLDPATDSAYAASFAIEVGSTMLDALNQLYAEGWIRWHVRPGTMILDVWRGREGTPSSSATLAAGVNLTSLNRSETDKYANAVLVQWDQGYEPVEDLAAIAAYGTRVEALISADSTSVNDAIQTGTTELIKRVQEGLPAITCGVEPVSTADCPYEGFTIGDWVTIPDKAGTGTEVVRVLSIACQQDALGYAVWSLELNRKLLVAERQNAELLRQIGGRLQIIRGVVS